MNFLFIFFRDGEEGKNLMFSSHFSLILFRLARLLGITLGVNTEITISIYITNCCRCCGTHSLIMLDYDCHILFQS